MEKELPAQGNNFSFAVVQGVTDTAVVPHNELWEEFKQRFRNPPEREVKEGPAWIAATFGMPHRADANVASVTALVLDFDEGNLDIADIQGRFDGHRYIAHTTHSSRLRKRRWRVVLPYARPATPAEHAATFTDLAEQHRGLDKTCRTPAHLFFWPAVRPGTVGDYFLVMREGSLLEPRQAVPETPAPPVNSAPGKVKSQVHASPVKEADLTERERQLAGAVRGIDNQDLSVRDHAVLCELIKLGATDAEAGRILCAGFWREKLRKNRSYLARSIAAARKSVGDDTAASVEEGNANSEMVKARDEAFREESKAIGEGPAEAAPPPPGYTLAQMTDEAIYISDGQQVTLRSDPRLAWSFADFAGLTAASVHRAGKQQRPMSVAQAWKQSPSRATVHRRTFMAGGPLFCQDPEDVKSINTWREPPRIKPPKDWRKRVEPFLDHVEFLVPDKIQREFLWDWLAHIEQHPGVLPHVHVLMVTPTHGIGRNWAASVLARVWAGVVALDVDLPALLDGGFNGRLSRKTLVVVNEIAEGGSTNAYRHTNRLRTLLTDLTRHINPKYGKDYLEFNAARWLMFSNHHNALPLDKFDRRVYVIENPETPKSVAYYTQIYRLAAETPFIASIREWLRVRDIRSFNPGQHAPLTAAKKKVIEASTSESEQRMQHLVDKYPADVIAGDRLCQKLWDHPTKENYGALANFAARVKARKYGARVYLSHRPRGQRQQGVWIMRNVDQWLKADEATIVAEIKRGEEAEIKRDEEADKS